MIKCRFVSLLVVALAVSARVAEARFLGNYPETVPAEQAQQSRDLASRSLMAISQLFAGLAEYETSGNTEAINTLLSNSASILKGLSSEYTALAKAVAARDTKLLPEAATKEWPRIQEILSFYQQDAAKFTALSAGTGQMKDEVMQFSEQLSAIQFTGVNDHQTVLQLYDSLERLIYLAAAYAAINHTAVPQ